MLVIFMILLFIYNHYIKACCYSHLLFNTKISRLCEARSEATAEQGRLDLLVRTIL